MGDAEVVDVFVGEAIAAAADEDAGVAIPRDQTGGGEGLAGKPEGELGSGVGSGVEDVFEGERGEVQETMVLRF